MSFEVLERAGEELTLDCVVLEPEQANARLKELRARYPERVFFMRKVQAPADDSWQRREIARFADGTYKRVPWYNEPWAPIDHFAHVSTDNPSMIAYTPSAEHGAADRQVRIRPGKYLESVIPQADVNSAEDWQRRLETIASWIARYNVENSTCAVQFAATSDEIEDVYSRGPISCMTDDEQFPKPFPEIRPVRVYGAGDLEVAYLEEGTRVTARALIWRAKQTFGRCYDEGGGEPHFGKATSGDSFKLRHCLEQMGFTSNWTTNSYRGDPGKGFTGARLLKIETPRGDDWIMPYLDGQNRIKDAGEFWVISPEGRYYANETNGTLCGYSESYSACTCCGNGIDEGEGYVYVGEDYCESCYSDNITSCSHCGEDGHRDADWIVDEDGDYYCQSCADRRLSRCEDCEDYFSGSLNDVTDGTEVCDRCARNLTHTPCGDLCREGDEHDCDCSECGESREEEEACEPQGRIEDPRQVEMDFSPPRAVVFAHDTLRVTNDALYDEARNMLGTGPITWQSYRAESYA